MKKRTAFLAPHLVVKILIVVLALLAVVGLGMYATFARQTTPAPLTTHTPTQPQDTVDFAKIEDTPIPGSIRANVSLIDFSITSSIKVFRAGVHYYFIVANRGHAVHEFLIVPDKPDGSPLPIDEQYEHKLIEIEQVGPGSTLTINFVFPPSAIGRYEITCQMRGHYPAMRFPIVVTH